MWRESSFKERRIGGKNYRKGKKLSYEKKKEKKWEEEGRDEEVDGRKSEDKGKEIIG